MTEKTNHEVENLFNKRRSLKNKDDAESKIELDKIEKELAEKCAEDNRRKIREEIAGIKCEDGGVHSGRLWKLGKKLCPKSREPPTAMLD